MKWKDVESVMITKTYNSVGTLFFVTSCLVGGSGYAAVDQILNDSFFRNPAELSLVNRFQMLGGDILITPKLTFSGATALGAGRVTSAVQDNLPYLLADYRLNDQWVLGATITPSSYGHIEWPLDSIVAEQATTTDVLYYRYGLQSSYQVTDDLALGIGLNLESQQHYELNFVVAGMGNQINAITGLNYSADAGLFYKLTPKHAVTAAYYSPVNNPLGYGSSRLNAALNTDFSLNITQAAVALIGLQHQWTDKWLVEEKVYWSGWSIQKSINFTNSTTGTYVVPTNWKDTWSFQLTSRYAVTSMVAVLGSAIYETNPAPLSTNALGYPLAPTWGAAAGLDVSLGQLNKNASIQLIYSYATFDPNAIIDQPTSQGMISQNAQAAVFQFIYKI